MKYVFLGPAGSNINYIALTITDKTTPALAYHYNLNGTHDINKKALWLHSTHWTDESKKHLEDKKFKVVQILCVDKLEFLILNWFEKHSRKAGHDYPWYEDWIKEQKTAWRNVCKTPEDSLIRATLHWFYKLQYKNNPDIYDVPDIKNKFMFHLFYTNDFQSLSRQFDKYDVNYTQKMYSDWIGSQKIIFDSHMKIMSNLERPNNLNSFWQKGLALGLYGKNNNLTEQQAWGRYGKS